MKKLKPLASLILMPKFLVPIASGVSLIGYATLVYALVTFQSTSHISVGMGGQTPAGTSGSPTFAPNGRFLAFRSGADNLVSNDTNSTNDIFLRDLKTGALSNVSVNTDGDQSVLECTQPSLSPTLADGFNAVAFISEATNFGTVQTFSQGTNVFVRFPGLGITDVVSFDTEASQIGNAGSVNPSVTVLPRPNRAVVAFASDASNLVSDDTNDVRDIFVATFLAPTSTDYTISERVSIKRISVSDLGVETNDESQTPKISGGGRFVAFSSRASNLVSGSQPAETAQIYLYDLGTETIQRISQNTSGEAADSDCSSPSISFNGRYITYLTNASNIVAGASQGETALIMYDTLDGTSRQVNTSAAGVPGNDSARDGNVSPNGRFVTFSDDSTNLVDGDTNGVRDVFVKDMNTGEIARLSVSSESEESDGASDTASASAATFNSLSAQASFRSFGSNLDETPVNGGGDIFRTNFDLSPRAVTEETRLEVPADLTLRGKRATISMERFSGFVDSSFAGDSILAPAATSSAENIQYRILLRGVSRRSQRLDIISRRNRITSARLNPGVYTVKYRVVAMQGSNVVQRTPFSPRQRFVVR